MFCECKSQWNKDTYKIYNIKRHIEIHTDSLWVNTLTGKN
jgi:hypothetical protein